ncbi:helix-turn-helix domain-containing protein [Nocardia jejuensis]|uniref:helix-turn-helix domain-containing protein n=1 Tax=Nocardia jejuensis TaxID=328049 RepID=UPI000836BC74|nr:AraC family transcriptional regulator [Nocardia jejuensis]
MAEEPVSALPRTCYPTVWLSPGHALYAGRSLDLGPHSGSVWCLAVGVDEPFTVRVAGVGSFTGHTALIPPRTTHQLISAGGRMIFCYLDPASRRASAAGDLMTDNQGPVRWLHTAEETLRVRGNALLDVESLDDAPSFGERTARGDDAVRAARTTAAEIDRSSEFSAAASDWIDLAAPADRRGIDSRIADVTRWMLGDPAGSLSARELAMRVGLSESRFLHLFRQEAGTSLRRYRLWVRMMHAATLIGEGRDLTTAAVESGFASPSHLADRFRTTFGLSATRLREAGIRVRIGEQYGGRAVAASAGGR